MISFGMLLPVAAEQTFNWIESGTKVELENKLFGKKQTTEINEADEEKPSA